MSDLRKRGIERAFASDGYKRAHALLNRDGFVKVHA